MAYFRYVNKLKKNDEPSPDWLVYWDYTKSVPDKYGDIPPTINNTPYSRASYLSSNGATIDSNGVHIIGDNGILIPNNSPLLYTNRTMEIKFGEVSKAFSTDVHGRLIMFSNTEGFIFRKQTQKWQMYVTTNGNIGWLDNDIVWNGESDPNIFSNKTLKIVYDKNKKLHFYLNNKLIWEYNEMKPISSENWVRIEIGCNSQSYFNTTIKSLGIYNTPPESLVLLHFEDDFVNDQITDAKGNTFTRSNGNVTISNAHKFGEKSLHLNGGGILQSENIKTLNFNGGDFTIDFWVKITSSSRMSPVNIYYAGINIDIDNRYPRMWFINEQGNAWVISGDNGSGTSNIRIASDEWTHIAYVRNGEYITLYVNGKVGRRQNIGNIINWCVDDNVAVRIGSWDLDRYYMFYGDIDEVRIIDKAVWTDEFTPPTAPYTN